MDENFVAPVVAMDEFAISATAVIPTAKTPLKLTKLNHRVSKKDD